MSLSFAEQVRRFGDKAAEKQDQALRKVSLDLFSRIIMRTPVDTGRLRGNWQATLGKPAAKEVNRTDLGPVTDDGSGGGQATRDMALVVLGADSPTVFHLANTLPYAARIEYEGHSRIQAPQGMVRRSVAEFQDIVKDILG